MCSTPHGRNSSVVTLRTGRQVRVDSCMGDLIRSLQQLFVPLVTLGCCCGHGKYPKTLVILRGGQKWVVFLQWNPSSPHNRDPIPMPRKRRFYKTDNEGFYFIPETIHEKTGRA